MNTCPEVRLRVNKKVGASNEMLFICAGMTIYSGNIRGGYEQKSGTGTIRIGILPYMQ